MPARSSSAGSTRASSPPSSITTIRHCALLKCDAKGKITISYLGLTGYGVQTVSQRHRGQHVSGIPNNVFTLNQRIPSFSIERAPTPHRRGISEVTPRPEREEEGRQTGPTQRPDLARKPGTQGADAPAEAVALVQAEVEIEIGPTRRSQRQWESTHTTAGGGG
jgi:hypothetical protein